METSLHRELKQRYAGTAARVEVRVGGYRIDAVRRDSLVEIQFGSLAAIRDKVRRLLEGHRVLVVKPIVARKTLIKLAERDGPVVSRRLSPRRRTMLDLFEELVYFTRLFPHPRLTIEAVLVEVEEWRYPGHGRRRRWRRNDHVVADQRLLSIGGALTIRKPRDLWQLLPADLPAEFDTSDLARLLDRPRWVAQQIAYCLRETGAVTLGGKRGNTRLYGWRPSAHPSRRRARPA